MKVLLVGGGSGGHIMPLRAIAKQLKQNHKNIEIHSVSERFSRFSHLVDGGDFDVRHRVFAGKLRRYHGESWLRRLSDVRTILLNLKDLVLIVVGTMEAILLLARVRPSVVFIKGGYVGVPLGLASRLLRIPYITHDSDATPGLTNRLVGRRARFNAVGMPSGNYPYSKDKIVYTGVPIRQDYLNISSKASEDRKRLGLGVGDKLILVLGGSNGARKLDEIMLGALPDLLAKDSSLKVVHQISPESKNLYAEYTPEVNKRIKTESFLDPLAPFANAADIVVTRAGATTIAELAALKKPLILVPHPELTGGHQTSNAEILERSGAALRIDQTSQDAVQTMRTALIELLASDAKREKLSRMLGETIKTDATAVLANLIYKVGQGKD